MSSSLLQMNTHSLSILSRFYFYEIEIVKILLKSTLLSILSRFYFYNVHTNNIRIRTYLSILSRFYFYKVLPAIVEAVIFPFNPIKVLFLPDNQAEFGLSPDFQSYQGSIFTKRFLPCGFCHLSFNPIKVLFLPLLLPVFFLEYSLLSILSRFYFYIKTFDKIVKFYILSILSRFYFYVKCIS